MSREAVSSKGDAFIMSVSYQEFITLSMVPDVLHGFSLFFFYLVNQIKLPILIFLSNVLFIMQSKICFLSLFKNWYYLIHIGFIEKIHKSTLPYLLDLSHLFS